MRSAGDGDVVDPLAHPRADSDERPAPDVPFDPELETGYLSRPRDHDLSPELGAVPFDPGEGTGYDERRARKAVRRRRREERERRAQARRVQKRRAESKAPAVGQPQPALAAAAAAERLVEDEPEPVEPERAPAPVTELRPAPSPPPREPLAERLERERLERERAERERRARIERERAKRDRAQRERRERLHRERQEKLRREHQALHRRRPKRQPEAGRPTVSVAQVRPRVTGPVRKRARAAENRRRAAARRRGLFWPTAKAGFAITLVLGLSAGLGSVLGLPVPGVDAGSGGQSLASSASIFGVDAGTPTGLSSGYVFPLIGPHDFGEGAARFGAARYGHIHEGQDIFAKSGRPEVAVHDGVVVDRGRSTDPDSGGRGNYIAIYSAGDDRSFVYMHMLKPSPVQLGQQVHAGEVVGQVGCTGECDGPHLHFEVRIGKASLGAETKPVDPLPYLRQWPQATPG